MDNKLKIFISYSTKDAIEASMLAQALTYHNHKVFYAGDKQTLGVNWFEEISSAIQSADLIIALVTENFLSSSWGNFELGAVFATHSSQAILPVVVGEITPPSFLMKWWSLKVDSISSSIDKIIAVVKMDSLRTTKGFQQAEDSVNVEPKYLDEKISSLHKALLDNRLSLVCGAGISKPSDIPEWDVLLTEILNNALTELVGAKSNQIDSIKLLEKLPKSNLIIARTLQDILKDDFPQKVRETLYAKKKMSYNPTIVYPHSDLMKAIVELARPRRTGKRLESIITLNFDDIIEQSLTLAGVDFCSIWKEGQTCEVEALPIYHVHGFLPMCGELDEPNLVFGENSYHTQYVDPFIWSNLIQLTTFSSNICLFIGLSLNDPNIRRLLDYSQRKNNAKKHYIIYKIMPQKSYSDKVATMLIEKDALSLGLNVIWVNEFEQIPEILGRILKEQQKTANVDLDILQLGLQSGDLNFERSSPAFNKLVDQMDAYKSTEWICSPDHAKAIGRKQLPNALIARIKTSETFKFEKTLIISEHSWMESTTWEWVGEVFSTIKDNSVRPIDIHVIKEEKVKGLIEEKYFDMGIYKVGDKQFVGFFNHNPPQYKWQLGEDCYNEAEQNFAKLNERAESSDSILEMLAKHGIAKR